MIIDRKTYIEKLQRSKGNGLIKIITGLRRSGKYIGGLIQVLLSGYRSSECHFFVPAE